MQDLDRRAMINNFPGKLQPYERLIAGAPDGLAVVSIQDKVANTPIPVQITYFPKLKEKILRNAGKRCMMNDYFFRTDFGFI